MRTLTVAIFTWSIIAWCALAPRLATTGVRTHKTAVAAVKRLQPALSHAEAGRLARAAISASARCPVTWKVLVSIAFHESSLRPRAINHDSEDYGLMQISKANIARLKLNKDRLMTDPHHAFDVACKILTANRNAYPDLPYWLGLYRSGTALWKPSIRANAQRYDKMVRATAEEIGQ